MLQRSFLGFSVVMLSLLPIHADAAGPCDWVRVTTDINFCIKEGADVKGRTEMREAISSPAPSQEVDQKFENGFDKCQKDKGIKNHYQTCRDYDPKRLLNIGRATMGLPLYP
ncbi:hypothetical protein [Bradyrhizobium japonicum]|uniref:hypothetical protein n=1 Tax=Bradyrhizobium japonicum TaxID=375 RepID=UPI001E460A1D|nr:hypothetical protein [Bradyrhizobium japonicum]MCD9825324.1 hypothetical protein [Bradyrhizobium japonicum]MCD9898301.1 hypothetical protein [Bradyrhizobium japonicum]MEB2674938.1 hypothetical protein [Bradyrhizobium japonicum]WLB33324.1 hypothetical protein QIH85_22970 [Bradyrhizobium japonicum]WRI94086.1 hypothetical protein R3F75_25355 [Bradyrhizobium japonicum]